jgi:hypothetical protein
VGGLQKEEVFWVIMRRWFFPGRTGNQVLNLPAITSALLGSSIHVKIPVQPRVSGHFLS